MIYHHPVVSRSRVGVLGEEGGREGGREEGGREGGSGGRREGEGGRGTYSVLVNSL